MIYRKIGKDEAKKFANLSSTAFHSNAEEAYEEIEKDKFQIDNIRVLESEEGRFVAGLRLIEMDMYLDGKLVKCGGIGDVSSYPEYRRSGNVSKLFEGAFEEMYDEDYVISFLYPFSHAYYRKYGYELCRRKDIISIDTEKISYGKDDGYVRQHIMDTDDDLSEDIKKIYLEYAKSMNFMVKRKDGSWFWNRVLKKDAYSSKAKVYVYYLSDGTPAAYLLYQFEKVGQYDLKAKIFDMAFINRAAFNSLLRFVYRLAPAVVEASFSCPATINPLEIMDDPYDVQIKSEPGGMMRIVNVKKALETIKAPIGTGSTAIKVIDSNIEKNCGVYVINFENEKYTITNDNAQKPDLECSIHALSQLVCGFRTIEEIAHRADVKVMGELSTLNRVFVKKPIHTQDFF